MWGLHCSRFAHGNVNAATTLVAASAHPKISDADFPAKASGREKLAFSVRQSMLQCEPQHWGSVEFCIRDQFVELSVRKSTAASIFDPEGRDRMIHCGVALQHLKLTLKRHGCFGRVDMFPDLDQPDLAARVHLGNGGMRSDFEKGLFKAMEGEETVCRLQASISGVDSLRRAAAGERSWLELARCEGSQQRLKELVLAPERIRATEIQVQNETVTHSSIGRWKLPRFTRGILHQRLGQWRKPPVSIKVLATRRSDHELFESTPFLAPEGTYAVLKTKTDDKHGWLAAGQTLGALLLHARTLGLPCVRFPNALRPPELRAELRTAIGHKGFMQVILCFNATKAELPAGVTGLLGTMTSRPSFA